MLGAFLAPPLGAQNPPPAPSPNPLVQLMQSQPNIDTSAPVTARAEFDPPRIRPGEPATYRVVFNAMQASVQWPEDVIAPDALRLRASARGQAFRPGGAGLLPQTTFNYRAQPTNEGVFTVPRFLVYVAGQPVTVPAAQLEVSRAAPAVPRPALTLTADATDVYVGQSVAVRAELPATAEGVLAVLSNVELSGDGFVNDTATARQQVRPVERGGRTVTAFVYETMVTPLRPGRIVLRAQGHTAGLQFAGPITITGQVTIPGGGGQFTLLDSEPLAVRVRPLPREGELPGFTGGIGRFESEPPVLSTNALRAGEPLTLTVRVRGEGNLARLVPPPPPRPRDWQVFAARPDSAPAALIAVRGFASFQFTLLPGRDGLKATPAIPFSFFDPVKGAYVDLTIPAVPVTVRPGVAPPLPAVTSDAGDAREAEPRLSGLAAQPGRGARSLVPHQAHGWFPVAAGTPLLAFAGLWWWDRHRRFHAAHPEIRIRRRARKQLLREWASARRAAGLGDTARFAAHAVNALRAGTAPHLPANPEALVARDVVPLLAGPEAAALGDAVRQIFAGLDARRFAPDAPEAAQLLALRNELERALAQLEEKLRD